MKLVFGILSLLFVLAAIAFVAKKQLQAADGSGAIGRAQEAGRKSRALPDQPAEARSPTAGVATLPEQARSMQERARDETSRALQQGADRNKRADEP